MAIKRENIPNASTLVNSMRSIGYDFESAVADIIDNSISAKAKNIEISFSSYNEEEIYLQIIDDGLGMNKSGLFEAMRFGSVKDKKRSIDDLGKFGLGLKTASISQCKKVTLISKQMEIINGFSWDLDLLSIEKSWDMYELTYKEIQLALKNNSKIFDSNSYTVVIWEKFDTLEKDVTISNNIYDIFMRRIKQMEKHISLVFHRFLESRIRISLNGLDIVPIDPFLSKHPKTLIKPEQVINTKTKDNKNEKVKMQVFVLPYFKDFRKEDYEKLGGKDGLDDQGFYIYRNERLIIHGTWFKIKPKAELSRNARIRIDIPNTLDNLWSIDIKKQSAIIPNSLLSQLRNEVSDAVTKSRQLHDYKGQIQTKDGSIWKKLSQPRDKTVFYKINSDSDLIKSLINKLDEKSINILDKIFNLIELSLPYKDIYNSVSEKKEINQVDSDKEDQLLQQAYGLYLEYKDTRNLNKESIIENICSYEPFLSAKIQGKLLVKVNGR